MPLVTILEWIAALFKGIGRALPKEFRGIFYTLAGLFLFWAVLIAAQEAIETFVFFWEKILIPSFELLEKINNMSAM